MNNVILYRPGNQTNQNDKNLLFQAQTGKYEGNVIRFNKMFQTVVWHTGDVDEAVMIDLDFLSTRWKILSIVNAQLIRKPIKKFFETCFA
jgi:hypothetical protein